jgi:hypothetical protein
VDPIAQQVGVGGALFLAALGILLKAKPWERKNGNGKKNSAGEKDPSYWTGEIGRIVEQKLSAHDAIRNEEIRKLLEREFQIWGASRTEELRRLMKETIGDWLDTRLRKP